MPKKYFPDFQYLRENNLRWCYVDGTHISLIRGLSRDYSRLLLESPPAESSHISFSYQHSNHTLLPVFVKVYKVRHIKHRIRETLRAKHKYYGFRYGIAEVSNILRAKEKGLSCPNIYAIGEVRKGLLIDSYIVIMEYLSDYCTLSEILRNAGPDHAKLAILKSREKLLFDLYKKGIFHIDLNSKNIMIAPDKGGGDKIVDFEYIKFLSKPDNKMFAFQVGYLYQKWCGHFVLEKLYDTWAESLFRSLSNLKDNSNLLKIYEQAKSRHFSRKEIFSLAIPHK